MPDRSRARPRAALRWRYHDRVEARTVELRASHSFGHRGHSVHDPDTPSHIAIREPIDFGVSSRFQIPSGTLRHLSEVREQMLPLKTLQRLQPEARLALAVLEDAAETLRTTHRVQTLRARRLAAHTWVWVKSDDAHHPFAFRVICQHLEFDAQWLRAGLARWRPFLPPRPIHDEVTARKRRRAA